MRSTIDERKSIHDQQISDKAQIKSLMSMIASEKPPIRLVIPDSREKESCAAKGMTILESDRLLSFDNIESKHANELFLTADRLQCVADMRSGSRIMFFTSLLPNTRHQRHSFFAPWPNLVYYTKAREYFRMPIPLSMKSALEIKGASPFLVDRITDIAIMGIGFAVRGDADIEIGSVYSDCEMAIEPFLPKRTVTIEVTRISNQGHFKIVGARFIHASKRDLRAIEDGVAIWQRHLIRHRLI